MAVESSDLACDVADYNNAWHLLMFERSGGPHVVSHLRDHAQSYPIAWWQHIPGMCNGSKLY